MEALQKCGEMEGKYVFLFFPVSPLGGRVSFTGM